MQNMISLQNRFIVDDSQEKIDCEEFNKRKKKQSSPFFALALNSQQEL
jgi:hypothetical protein